MLERVHGNRFLLLLLQQSNGNCNAPRAITLSAIIYCLRCIVGHDLPLNQVHALVMQSCLLDLDTIPPFMQGCLSPIEIIIPELTILNPSEEVAVIGGNVLTSQRVVDVVFAAFSVCAASQVTVAWL